MNWLCYELINAFSYRLDEYWMSGKWIKQTESDYEF